MIGAARIGSSVSFMHRMDAQDTRLCDLIQNELPLVEQPYAALGEKLEMPEDEVLERVSRLRSERIIRQVSAIFDTRKLGYRSMLVAARTAPERADAAAEVINSHPGVTHNYQRDHEFNIWFTLGVPPNSRLGLDALGRAARRDGRGRVDPAAARASSSSRSASTSTWPAVAIPPPRRCGPSRRRLRRRPTASRSATSTRSGRCRATCGRSPSRSWARPSATASRWRSSWTHAHRFLATGQMRRFAAVLYHRSAGFVYNGMGVWKAPEDQMDELGSLMASFRGVSHCYQRPTYPDWPYNLFSMTHGRTKKECEDVLDAIAAETGLTERVVLYSTKEWKKTRLVYFSPDAEEWEREHAPGHHRRSSISRVRGAAAFF